MRDSIQGERSDQRDPRTIVPINTAPRPDSTRYSGIGDIQRTAD